MAVWFTSDLHIGHEKAFLYGSRGYTSSEEHDKNIITNWNHTVQPNDIVWVLGDLMLGSNVEGNLEKLALLTGEIHIIGGNHDTLKKIAEYKKLPNMFFEGYAHPLKYNKIQFFLSHYPTVVSNYSEYPRVINLCGHTHTKDRWADWDKGCYHIELDAHHNQLVNIETIYQEVQEKMIEDRTSLGSKQDTPKIDGTVIIPTGMYRMELGFQKKNIYKCMKCGYGNIEEKESVNFKYCPMCGRLILGGKGNAERT